MHRSLRQLAMLGLATAMVAACAEDPQQPSQAKTSTAPSSTGTTTAPTVTAPARRLSVTLDPSTLPQCQLTTDQQQRAIADLLPQLFGTGGGRRGTAQGYQNNMDKAVKAGDYATAQYYATLLINYTLQNWYAGTLNKQQSDRGTRQRAMDFIYLIECYTQFSPIVDIAYLFDAQYGQLITNTTPTTVVTDPNKNAGVKINQGDVPATLPNGQPFSGTYVSIEKTTNPLPTSLDWYGIDGYKAGAFEFVSNPEVTFTNPVLTGVCINYDNAIVTSPSDLRMAHGVASDYASTISGNYVLTTPGGTIEIGAPTSTSPLGICPSLPSLTLGGFDKAKLLFARLILPSELLAASTGGSTGSTVYKFSPFAAVDIKLSTTSTGPSSPTYIPLNSTSTAASASVTVKTRNSKTGVGGVNVNFAATSPAGSSFSPTSANTDANGTATSSWTVVAGSNTGTGTPSQSPLTFTPASASFSVTAVQETQLSYVSPTSLANGTRGTAYPNTTFTASGGQGAGTYTWSVASGSLPPGMSLSAAGVLSGTPTAAGVYTFTPQVASGSQTASPSAALSLTIALPPVSISPTTLSAGLVGALYSQQLSASGGAGANSYSNWRISAGTLPPGLGISSAGLISGQPTTTGSYNFTVAVTSTDGQGNSLDGTQSYAVQVVSSTAVTLSFVSAPSKSICYAVNQPITPAIVVRVADRATGTRLNGVTVGLVAVTNNGTNVAVNPPSAVTGNTGSVGDANFGGPTINKTGGYALVASTTSPAAASISSAKFTISPSCP